MTPPINIDGETVQEITIDSQPVNSVTMDGDQVFGGAIPDSEVSDSDIIDHWDPITAFDGRDGDSISSWDGRLGNLTVTGGSPSVLGNGISGYTSLDFNGAGDTLSTDFSSPEGQPFGVFFVFQLPTLPSDLKSLISSKNSNVTQITYSDSSDTFTCFAGDTLTGPSLADTTVPIVGFYGFDGSNTIIRNNQTEVTGNAGTNSLDGVSFGSVNDSDRFWPGLLGEIVVTNTIPSQSTIEDEEQRMADRWGITL